MPKKQCSVDGCEKPNLARTWCATHYMRWRTTGEVGGAELLRVSGNPGATEKKCRKCKQVRKVEDFYADKRNVDGLFSHCKPCILARQREYSLQKKYGLTAAQFDELVISQSGRCDICGTADKKLVVDHCHIGGQVRALLCDQCNTGIGMFSDNPDILRNAIAYLERNGK